MFVINRPIYLRFAWSPLVAVKLWKSFYCHGNVLLAVGPGVRSCLSQGPHTNNTRRRHDDRCYNLHNSVGQVRTQTSTVDQSVGDSRCGCGQRLSLQLLLIHRTQILHWDTCSSTYTGCWVVLRLLLMRYTELSLFTYLCLPLFTYLSVYRAKPCCLWLVVLACVPTLVRYMYDVYLLSFVAVWLRLK